MAVIEVKNLSKSFKVYSDKGRTLKERLLFKNRRAFEERQVLKDISFSVEKGETVGLIGHNGCGKSTLLKLLTRILFPDEGTVKVVGRVASLLELGAGFHPDLSGRENIYANAAIFGLKKREIDQRLEGIIEFSELRNYIDNPVRTYSSGMYTRLAFSVAISVNADVLLVDEILAVGDVNFQQKCLKHMRKLRDSGVTIVFVTHDTATVESFCTRAIWLHDGRIQSDGATIETIDKYLSFMAASRRKEVESSNETDQQPASDSNRFGSREVIVRDAHFLNHEQKVTNMLECGEKAVIEIDYEIKVPQEGYNFAVGFYSQAGEVVFATNTNIDNLFPERLPEEGVVKFEIEKLNLLEGEYKLTIAIVNVDQEPLDYYRVYSTFNVLAKNKATGTTFFPHKWVLPEQGENNEKQ